MQVPWSAAGRQLTTYGPASIVNASRKIELFDEKIGDCEKYIFGLEEDCQLRLWNSEACLTKKTEIIQNIVFSVIIVGVFGGIPSVVSLLMRRKKENEN